MPHWLQRLYGNLPLGGGGEGAKQQCGYIQTCRPHAGMCLLQSVSPTVRNRPTYEESRCQEGDKSRKKVFSFFCAPNIVFSPPSVFCIREKKIPGGPPSVNAHTLKSPRKKKKNILGFFSPSPCGYRRLPVGVGGSGGRSASDLDVYGGGGDGGEYFLVDGRGDNNNPPPPFFHGKSSLRRHRCFSRQSPAGGIRQLASEIKTQIRLETL